jgi:D-xylose transport system substrate-binding protein
VLLKPVSVTKDNIKDTVIADGFLKPADICTGKYAALCKAQGIQ